jgi:hypothetical protein
MSIAAIALYKYNFTLCGIKKDNEEKGRLLTPLE